MSTPKKIILARIADQLPFSAQTIYNGRLADRWPWLTRVSPEGRRTRELWVDVALLDSWARARGLRLDLDIGGGAN